MENTSYHQFLVRKKNAILKRKAEKALIRFEQAVPKLQELCAIRAKTSKWVNLAEMQRVYNV